MAPGNNAQKYCTCCKQFVTRKAELAHRCAMFSHPYASATPDVAPKPIISLTSVFRSAELPSIGNSDSTGMATDSHTNSVADRPMTDDFVEPDIDVSFCNPEDTVEEAQDTSIPSFPSLDIRSAFAARVDDDDMDDDDTIDEGEIPLLRILKNVATGLLPTRILLTGRHLRLNLPQ